MSVRLKQLAQDGAIDGQPVAWDSAAGEWIAKYAAIPISKASETVTTPHTGAANSLVNSMTITPGAGDYKVEFSSSWELSDNNSAGEVSVYVNGVQVADSVRNVARGGGATAGAVNGVNTHAYVTGVGAGQAIEIRAAVSAGTLSIFQRTLIVTKVR